MKNRINTLKYGEISSRYADNIAEGELLKIKNNSLAKCENAYALGYDGIQQRNGWVMRGAMFDRSSEFVSFELTFQDGNAILFIGRDYLLIYVPNLDKYYVTELAQEDWYQYQTVTSVTTNQVSTIFIASSRGVDAWALTNNLYTSQNGTNILRRVQINGLNTNSTTTVNTEFYFVVAKKSLGDTITNVLGQNVQTQSLAAVINENTIDENLSGFWFPNTGNIQIGAEITYSFQITKTYIFNQSTARDIIGTFNGTAKVSQIQAGYFTESLADKNYRLIYPSTSLPPSLISQPGIQIFNPVGNWTGATFCKLDIPLSFTSSSGEFLPSPDLILASFGIPIVVPSPYPLNVPTAAASIEIGASGVYQSLVGSLFVGNVPKVYGPMLRHTTAVVGGIAKKRKRAFSDLLSFRSDPGGFLQYKPSNPNLQTLPFISSYQNRLWLCSLSSVRASEVNNPLNFVTNPTTKDNLTSTDPIQATLDDAASIYWIIPIKDLGQLIGTSKGLKLLTPNASSFRLGIISSNNTIPSAVPPIFATIGGVSGAIFVNFDYSKVLFLQAVSQLESIKLIDLTQFFNPFESEKIKKMISLPFLSDRMTCVLTEKGNLFRLVTGNNDKFSWSQDVYGIEEIYKNFDSFPPVGIDKVFYIATDTGAKYTWSINKYIVTDYIAPKLFDVTTFNGEYFAFFSVPPAAFENRSVAIVSQNLFNNLSNLSLQSTADFNTPNLLQKSASLVHKSNNSLPKAALQGVIPVKNLPNDYLEYLFLPSKMFIETHYDEYLPKNGKSSKHFNKKIQDLIITGQNLFNVTVGYFSTNQDYYGNYVKRQQDVQRKFFVKTPVGQAVNLNGNYSIQPSHIGLRISIYIASYNLTPTIITSLSYQILFP